MTEQGSSDAQTSTLTEKRQADEYLATLRAESQEEYVPARVDSVSLCPVFAIHNGHRTTDVSLSRAATIAVSDRGRDPLFRSALFLCELTPMSRDTPIYVPIEGVDTLYAVFSDSFQLSNPLDQDLTISFSETKDIALTQDGVQFKSAPNKTFDFERNEYTVLEQAFDRYYATIRDMNKLDAERFLSAEHALFDNLNEQIKQEFVPPEKDMVEPLMPTGSLEQYAHSFHSDLVETCLADAPQSVECYIDDYEVSGRRIKLYVLSNDIPHTDPLVFSFSKPDVWEGTNLKELLDRLGAKSLDGLVNQTVYVTQSEPYEPFQKSCRNWYLKPPSTLGEQVRERIGWYRLKHWMQDG